MKNGDYNQLSSNSPLESELLEDNRRKKREQGQKQQRERHKGKSVSTILTDILSVVLIPASMLVMECLCKQRIFGSVVDGKLIYLVCFCLALGFLFSAVSMLFSGKGRRRMDTIVLALSAVLCSFHMSYQNNFHSFFSWQTLGQAKDVVQFWKEALEAALGVWYLILAFFVPVFFLCFFGKKLFPDSTKRNAKLGAVTLCAALALYLPMLGVLQFFRFSEDLYTPYYYYTYLQSDLEQTFQYYGVLNATRLDVKQLIFGAPEENMDFLDDSIPVSYTDYSDVSSTDINGNVEYGYNVMDIDFKRAEDSTSDRKLKNMDMYFGSLEPTRKNEYTGMFAGKNLIFLTLEGFSDKIIDPEFTPMLYKMSTEGFVFENSYNSIWGGSTATGEYANMTGNFYTTANCLKLSGSTYQPFALGNQFAKLGYKTFAYHNNSYTYYGRNHSHPNFGYTYKAIDNGLKLKYNGWPRSDEEMALATVDDYIGTGEPFHAYYMTVSGHANYSYGGNQMANKHSAAVEERYQNYPSEVRAYIACQYEVELMLQALVNKLDEAGILEDTVFAMEADHYPYALKDASLARLYGLPAKDIRQNFDLYRNRFILWCASMEEPVVVTKPCSTIDIVPTLSNLFGLEYDSRLLMGSDILAEGDHFALLKVKGWSWISTEGTYIASWNRFIPSETCTLSDEQKKEYINQMNAVVKAKSSYSMRILDLDYYRHILAKGQ